MTSVRPTPAIERRTQRWYRACRDARPRWSRPVRRFRRPVRKLAGYRSLGPRSSGCAAYAFGRPSACSDDFPRSPAPTSRWKPAKSSCSAGRTVRARPRCCGSARGCCRCARGRLKCSVWISRRNQSAYGARSRSSGTRRSVTTTSPSRRTSASSARSTGHSAADGDAALERVGLQRVANVAHGRLSQGQRRRLSLANALGAQAAPAAARRAARRTRRARPRRAGRSRAGRTGRRLHGA